MKSVEFKKEAKDNNEILEWINVERRNNRKERMPNKEH